MNILKEISITDTTLISEALGNFGLKLKEFTQAIDLDHPDINVIYNGVFTPNSSFSITLMEYLDVFKYIKKNNYAHLTEVIHKVYTKLEGYSILNKNIDNPFKNQLHIRLVANHMDRVFIRTTKTASRVFLSYLNKKGMEIWEANPSSLVGFERNGTFYEEELKQVEKKIKLYSEHGLSSMAKEISNSLEFYREQIFDKCYGFNRVTLTNICVILAKMLSFSYAIRDKQFRITVPNSFFGEYSKNLKIGMLSSNIFWDYTPRIYPIYDLFEAIDCKELYDLLERYPEANNKAIFDNYWVLVPSIDINSNQYYEDNNYIFDENNEKIYYPNEKIRDRILDATLIKMGLLPYVIIGEKDGKSYFLYVSDYKKSY